MSGVAEFWELWGKYWREEKEGTAAWVEELRAAGVKAAHPDDGWHDRARRRVFLCYPHFNDGVGVGDRIALGRHDRRGQIVTVTEIERPILGQPWYRYEPIGKGEGEGR